MGPGRGARTSQDRRRGGPWIRRGGRRSPPNPKGEAPGPYPSNRWTGTVPLRLNGHKLAMRDSGNYGAGAGRRCSSLGGQVRPAGGGPLTRGRPVRTGPPEAKAQPDRLRPGPRTRRGRWKPIPAADAAKEVSARLPEKIRGGGPKVRPRHVRNATGAVDVRTVLCASTSQERSIRAGSFFGGFAPEWNPLDYLCRRAIPITYDVTDPHQAGEQNGVAVGPWGDGWYPGRSGSPRSSSPTAPPTRRYLNGGTNAFLFCPGYRGWEGGTKRSAVVLRRPSGRKPPPEAPGPAVSDPASNSNGEIYDYAQREAARGVIRPPSPNPRRFALDRRPKVFISAPSRPVSSAGKPNEPVRVARDTEADVGKPSPRSRASNVLRQWARTWGRLVPPEPPEDAFVPQGGTFPSCARRRGSPEPTTANASFHRQPQGAQGRPSTTTSSGTPLPYDPRFTYHRFLSATVRGPGPQCPSPGRT